MKTNQEIFLLFYTLAATNFISDTGESIRFGEM